MQNYSKQLSGALRGVPATQKSHFLQLILFDNVLVYKEGIICCMETKNKLRLAT